MPINIAPGNALINRVNLTLEQQEVINQIRFNKLFKKIIASHAKGAGNAKGACQKTWHAIKNNIFMQNK